MRGGDGQGSEGKAGGYPLMLGIRRLLETQDKPFASESGEHKMQRASAMPVKTHIPYSEQEYQYSNRIDPVQAIAEVVRRLVDYNHTMQIRV